MKKIKETLNNIINKRIEDYIYLDENDRKSEFYIEKLEINIENKNISEYLMIEKVYVNEPDFTFFKDLKECFELKENFWKIENLKPVSKILNLIYSTNQCSYDFSELLKNFDSNILFHNKQKINHLDLDNHIFVYSTNLIYLNNEFHSLLQFKIFDVNLKIKFNIFFFQFNDILYVSHNNNFFIKFEDYYDYHSKKCIEVSKLKSDFFSNIDIENFKINNIAIY